MLVRPKAKALGYLEAKRAVKVRGLGYLEAEKGTRRMPWLLEVKNGEKLRAVES
jgi:hypothetical protein